MKIGEKVRILREAQKMTLEDLAQAVGIHQVTLSQYERGTRPLPYDAVERFAEALGADVALFAADQPWSKIEEARSQLDAVMTEVRSILRSADSTSAGPTDSKRARASYADDKRAPGADTSILSARRLPAKVAVPA